jgi:hypothetical protein
LNTCTADQFDFESEASFADRTSHLLLVCIGHQKCAGNWRKFHDEKIVSFCDDEKLLSVAFRCARKAFVHAQAKQKAKCERSLHQAASAGWACRHVGMSPTPRPRVRQADHDALALLLCLLASSLQRAGRRPHCPVLQL